MKAIFLDRDGVINEDRDDYVKNTGELKIFPFVPDAIRRLCDSGWQIFVASNQQGIAKGIIAQSDLYAIENEISRKIEDAGGKISGFYYCKHLAGDNCSCRKPKAGLLLSACDEHGIDLSDSIMIGDSERDIAAGKAAGCRTILVLTGKLNRESIEKLECKPDYVADDLYQAVDYIVKSR